MYTYSNWLVNIKGIDEGALSTDSSLEEYIKKTESYSEEYFYEYRENYETSYSYKEAMEIIEADARFKIPLNKALYHVEYPCGTHEIEVGFEAHTHNYEFDTYGETYEECIIKLAHLLTSNPQ